VGGRTKCFGRLASGFAASFCLACHPRPAETPPDGAVVFWCARAPVNRHLQAFCTFNHAICLGADPNCRPHRTAFCIPDRAYQGDDFLEDCRATRADWGYEAKFAVETSAGDRSRVTSTRMFGPCEPPDEGPPQHAPHVPFADGEEPPGWAHAAELTNAGHELIDWRDDKTLGAPYLKEAIEHYQQAAVAWKSVEGLSAERSEEAAFWLTDATYWVVALKLDGDYVVSVEELEAARTNARAVLRSVAADARYRRAAGRYLIDIADSLARRPETSQQPTLKLPGTRLGPVFARDDYVAAHVPAPKFAPEQPDDVYAFEAAEFLESHGAAREAAARFRSIFEAQCKRSKWGEMARVKYLATPRDVAPAFDGLEVPCRKGP
jgi:hypothetical protein